MDARLALLDARVAEAAEAWLTDPSDTGVYGRLVTAVQTRRRHLDRIGSRFGGAHAGPDTVGAGEAEHPPGRVAAGATDAATYGDASLRPHGEGPATGALGVPDVEVPDVEDADVDVEDPDSVGSHVDGEGTAGVPGQDGCEPAWPAVRSVGSDLVGDPAAVLRRLRGG